MTRGGERCILVMHNGNDKSQTTAEPDPHYISALNAVCARNACVGQQPRIRQPVGGIERQLPERGVVVPVPLVVEEVSRNPSCT
jgi:hypothetical protein